MNSEHFKTYFFVWYLLINWFHGKGRELYKEYKLFFRSDADMLVISAESLNVDDGMEFEGNIKFRILAVEEIGLILVKGKQKEIDVTKYVFVKDEPAQGERKKYTDHETLFRIIESLARVFSLVPQTREEVAEEINEYKEMMTVVQNGQNLVQV